VCGSNPNQLEWHRENSFSSEGTEKKVSRQKNEFRAICDIRDILKQDFNKQEARDTLLTPDPQSHVLFEWTLSSFPGRMKKMAERLGFESVMLLGWYFTATEY